MNELFLKRYLSKAEGILISLYIGNSSIESVINMLYSEIGKLLNENKSYINKKVVMLNQLILKLKWEHIIGPITIFFGCNECNIQCEKFYNHTLSNPHKHELLFIGDHFKIL